MVNSLSAIATLVNGQSLTLGSDQSSDVVIKGPGVEKRHARISFLDGSIIVQDLDSNTGTFLNGSEIRGKVQLHPGDSLRLGMHELVIPSFSQLPTIHAPDKSNGIIPHPVALSVINASKKFGGGLGQEGGGRLILDQVSFCVEPGEFIGILGASGSGKSTLIKTVAGLVNLTEGIVTLNGNSMTSQSLRADKRIAYLPQDVVIHEALTPLVAMEYIARLKGLFFDNAESAHLLQSALERVGLWGQRDTPIHNLSGGQRKRAALAAELLGDPSLILLDEATSGLDPATEGEMMELFRALAREGRTVLCITHFPGRLHLCDKLVYLMQGKCIFFGSPVDFKHFFKIDNIEEVYSRQKEQTAHQWQERFRKYAEDRHWVDRHRGIPEEKGCHQELTTTSQIGNDLLIRQTAILLSRYFRLQMADWKNLLLLFAQAPIIALMIGSTFGVIKVPFAELHAADTKQVMFVMVLAILWCSGTASVREVVKESPILQHEFRFGVGLLPYLLSKFILLGLFSLIQAASLLAIVRMTTQLAGFFDLQLLVMGMTALVGVALGLLVSAAAGTSERAMTILPVLLIGQAIFSGGLARLNGWAKAVAMLIVPAFWSLEGLKSPLSSDLVNATYPGSPGFYQPPILGSGWSLPFTGSVLIAHISVFLLTTHWVMQLQLFGNKINLVDLFQGMSKVFTKKS